MRRADFFIVLDDNGEIFAGKLFQNSRPILNEAAMESGKCRPLHPVYQYLPKSPQAATIFATLPERGVYAASPFKFSKLSSRFTACGTSSVEAA
jgi:hypothetical protein